MLSRFSRVWLLWLGAPGGTTPNHRQQPARLPHPWDSPGKNTGVGCHFLLQCMKVKSEREVTQSCPTLSDPMDWSLPSSSIHGIFQAKYWSGVPLPSPHINITFCLYQVKTFCCKLRNSLFPVWVENNLTDFNHDFWLRQSSFSRSSLRFCCCFFFFFPSWFFRARNHLN